MAEKMGNMMHENMKNFMKKFNLPSKTQSHMTVQVEMPEPTFEENQDDQMFMTMVENTNQEFMSSHGRNLHSIHIDWNTTISNGTINWDLDKIREIKKQGK
jgi:hypothetical protein